MTKHPYNGLYVCMLIYVKQKIQKPWKTIMNRTEKELGTDVITWVKLYKFLVLIL